ncbi:MAG: hypothetical protein GC160_04405 [Acidobacteria bacterium]|nr:hypothetical protein [Acidobacteriota bacterium]
MAAGRMARRAGAAVWRLVRDEALALHREQSGQVTTLFLVAAVALALLLGLVINTAQRTSQRIEMQGAADAAAVAGGTWMARGMNLMALGNKGMSDLLAVMIEVHAVVEVSRGMKVKLGVVIASLTAASAAFPPAAPALGVVIRQLGLEIKAFETLANSLDPIDRRLNDPSSGIGWELMRSLDKFNQAIKAATPPLVRLGGLQASKANGADLAFVMSGHSESAPICPVGRGRRGLIAVHAEQCVLPELSWPVKAAVNLYCAAQAPPACISALTIAGPLLDGEVGRTVEGLAEGARPPTPLRRLLQSDVGRLRGLQEAIDEYNARDPGDGSFRPLTMEGLLGSNSWIFGGGGSMSWPQDSPLPMTLTDRPLANGDERIAEALEGAPVDYEVVRRILQFLAVARAESTGGILAPSTYQNPAPFGRLAYAQADVYNPSEWSMFSQNWRVKLARASLFGRKWKDIVESLGGAGGGLDIEDISVLNTH